MAKSKPKLTNTKVKVVNGKIEAGKEPRQITPDFFDLPEWAALNEDERRFVEEYIVDRNGTRAYFRAGLRCKSYSTAAVMAHLYLKREKVAAAVRKAHELLSISVQEDLSSIAANYQQIRDRCLQEVPVFDKEGNPTGEYRFEGMTALAANRELGLALGLISNKHKVEHSGEVAVKVEGVVRLELSDLTKLSLPARKEILQLLEAKESANGTI